MSTANSDNSSTLYNSLAIGIIEKCSLLYKITRYKYPIVCIPVRVDIMAMRSNHVPVHKWL